MRIFRIVALLVAFAGGAHAAPITFVHSGTGSGFIGATNFTSAAFTIIAVGDTNDRVSIKMDPTDDDGYSIEHLSASISIAGVGVFQFVTGTRTFVNNSQGVVGFSHYPRGDDLFNGPIDSAFLTWDMLSPIGPISGGGNLLQWDFPDVLTDGGVLRFFDDSNTNATFTAIPEPASGLLAAAGLLGIAVVRRRSRSQD